MRGIIRRVVAVSVTTLFVTALAAAPASAGTSNVAVSWDGVHVSQLSFNPSSSITITNGDSVNISYTGPSGSVLSVTEGTCSQPLNSVASFGSGSSTTISPTSTDTYALEATTDLEVSACDNLEVTVTNLGTTTTSTTIGGTPPPDVPEAPYTVALLGAAAALFGGGFYVVRRRRARVV